MSKMLTTPVHGTSLLSSSAQNFRPQHEIGNLLSSASNNIDPRMTFQVTTEEKKVASPRSVQRVIIEESK